MGVICCIIGIFKSKSSMQHILGVFFTRVSETIYFGLLLFTGFYIFYYHMPVDMTFYNY